MSPPRQPAGDPAPDSPAAPDSLPPHSGSQGDPRAHSLPGSRHTGERLPEPHDSPEGSEMPSAAAALDAANAGLPLGHRMPHAPQPPPLLQPSPAALAHQPPRPHARSLSDAAELPHVIEAPEDEAAADVHERALAAARRLSATPAPAKASPDDTSAPRSAAALGSAPSLTTSTHLVPVLPGPGLCTPGAMALVAASGVGGGGGGGGGVSVAAVASAALVAGRLAHTEKMSSILKKSEVLKEMEEETKRRRAMAHRSLDFLGSRNMRRSRDLLVDDGVPAAPAHAWADANQRSAPVSTLGRPVLGQADHPAISGSTGYAYGPTAPPPAQQAESGTRSLVRSGSGTESMLFKFRRNQASSVVGMVAVDAAGGGAGAAGASGPPAGLSAAGGGGSQSPAGGAGAGAASPGSGGAGASGSSQSPSSDPPSAPAASIPTSFTAQNVSALRKNRMSTLASVVIPPQNPAANPPPKSAAAANAKSFKEWYVHILNESDTSAAKHAEISHQVPESVELQHIFGSKGQDVNPVEHLMWAAKEYEGWKRNPLWNVREEESSASDAAQEDIDMAVRLVDIVSEARIAGLMYEEDLKIGDLDMVMLGSPKDLMDGLIFPLDQDMSFAEVFVATYRFFMPAQDLLDCLVGWYNADAEDTRFPGSEAFLRKNRKQIQNRAVRVLLMWIRNHWHDFHNDPRLYAELNFFVDYLGKVSFGNNQKLTQAIREQRLSWYTYQYIPMFSATRSGGPDQTKPWIAEWDIDDLAQNLTMIDHLHFRQLKPDMYLQLLHKPAQIKSGGFNVPFKIVMELCHWFRTVVAYTATVIAKEDNTKKKINYIKRFIKVAKACRDLSNYNTMFAIVYGLKRPAVLMWTQAWEGLPTKYMDQFKELDLLIDPADGYFNYNDVIRDQNPPAVPFLLPYIQDMIETHRNVPMLHEAADGEPKPINFQKFYHLYSIAAELEVFRLGSYHGKLKGDRESNLLLVNHMRSYAMLNDKALGEGLLFSSASAVSDWNETAAGASGNKAMKRATQMLSATKSDRPDGIKSLSQ